VLERPTASGADVAMRIFNADGSEAEMCGNGVRCVARFIHERAPGSPRRLAIQAGSKIVRTEISSDSPFSVRVEMGEPDEIKAYGRVRAGALVGDRLDVSMGNPHCVLFVDDDLMPINLAAAADAISSDGVYENGVNVEIARAFKGGPVAMRVYEDIVRDRMEPGTVLGSESELMERYETSRAVLRAAVRLLEHHSVATSRRGPGGGLVVTRQVPRAAIDATALYLAYRRAAAEDLLVVREAIEVGLVAQLAARRAEPDVAGRPAEPAARSAPPRAGDPDTGFHAAIAEAAGNPVLTLFLRIITELSSRTRALAGCGEDADARHREILAAVEDGDASLAQYRMRRHLSSRSPV